MFGYIRPLKGEMKVREYEQFRAMYCGLCHTLNAHCGIGARFLLSYDMCFAAMIFSGVLGNSPVVCEKRCVVSPFRPRKCICSDKAMEIAADCTVLLAYEKIEDGIKDEKGLKRFGSRLLKMLVRGKYKKSVERLPEFADLCRKSLEKLSEIEKERPQSIDVPASVFADMLSGLAVYTAQDQFRAAKELFFHVGRWIYIADAWDDVQEDLKSERYNCVISRFGLLSDQDRKKIDDDVALTLSQSAQTAAAAAELMDLGVWKDIVANILYLGLPSMARSIREGHTKQRSLKHGSL